MRPAIDVDALRNAAARHGLLLTALFGSRAKATPRQASDMDLAVLAQRPQWDNADWLSDLEADLSLACRGHEVDVSLLNEASPLLMFEVARTGRALFEEPGAFSDFKSRAARMYYDNERRMQKQADFLKRGRA